MKDKIIEVLKQIELDKNIKILFAVESGSRAWRLNSADSDYDIRFVFVRDIDEYIRVNPSDDVIMSFYDKDGNKSPQEGCFIDIEGFDIFKFTKMLSSSNPTVIEWLLSDIVYIGEKSKVFLDFATNQFNFKSLYYHYKSMCRSNYIKYLKSGNLVSYKKYLYAYRGLVNAKYVSIFKKLPNIDFNVTLDEIHLYLSDVVYNKLEEIISLKRQSREKEIIQNIVQLDNYIENYLKSDDDCPEERRLATLNDLNRELRQIVYDFSVVKYR